MTIDQAGQNDQLLRESRDGVRSVQFFIAAMAAQVKDLETKLAQVQPVVTGGTSSEEARRLEAERDAARQEVETLQARVAQLEQEVERQHVTFADHHAAKQENARLRAELEAVRASRGSDDEESSVRKRWLGR